MLSSLHFARIPFRRSRVALFFCWSANDFKVPVSNSILFTYDTLDDHIIVIIALYYYVIGLCGASVREFRFIAVYLLHVFEMTENNI